MGQKRPIIVTGKLTVAYTLTNAFADVPGLSCKVPKSGFYNIRCDFTLSTLAALDDCVAALAIDGTAIDSTFGENQYSASVLNTVSKSIDGIYLKKGQEVTLIAKYVSAAGGDITYSSRAREAKLQIVYGGY